MLATCTLCLSTDHHWVETKLSISHVSEDADGVIRSLRSEALVLRFASYLSGKLSRTYERISVSESLILPKSVLSGTVLVSLPTSSFVDQNSVDKTGTCTDSRILQLLSFFEVHALKSETAYNLL
jgi:hypothetical protein